MRLPDVESGREAWRDALALSLVVAALAVLAVIGIGHQLASTQEPASSRSRRLTQLIDELYQDSSRCTSTRMRASQDNPQSKED